jgi:hypothetical protein
MTKILPLAAALLGRIVEGSTSPTMNRLNNARDKVRSAPVSGHFARADNPERC